jgi:hypothetical protein
MQMGQLTNHLGEKDKVKFPSQPVTNPKACMSGNSSNQEHAYAIVTLRSAKQVDNHAAKPESDHAELEADHVVEPKAAFAGQEEKESDNKEERGVEPSTVTPIVNDPLRSFIPKAPYPERLKAPKKNAQFAKILEVFKQVQINIQFLDAI